MPGDQVTLAIDGQLYGGWTSIEIATGIDSVASSFRLGVTERWPGHPDRWAIRAGSAAVVAIGGETVVTGYVDHVEADIEGDRHSIQVAGRSRVADLVDCSAVSSPGSWQGQRVETIAAAIAAPFGIAVVADSDTGAPLPRFALQPGETAWDAIERMLRQRGLLGYSAADGSVRLVSPQPGAAAVTLTQGREPLAIAARHDVADRFSHYIAKGQSSGSDQASGAITAGPKGEADDAGVGRYRPLIVIAEDQATPASLRQRAEWEASVRAARAQTARVPLNGWRDPAGAIWQPMRLVNLVAPAVWIEAAMMVVSATFRFDEQGQSTELQLGRPEAYTRIPIPDDAQASSLLTQRGAAKLGRRR